MKTRNDHAATFVVVGFLAVLAGAICILLAGANVGARSSGGRNISGVAYLSVFLIPVGAGLVLRRRVAAVLLSLASGGLGLWLGAVSVMLVPLPWGLLDIGLGLLLLYPAWVTWRGWRGLR